MSASSPVIALPDVLHTSGRGIRNAANGGGLSRVLRYSRGETRYLTEAGRGNPSEATSDRCWPREGAEMTVGLIGSAQ